MHHAIPAWAVTAAVLLAVAVGVAIAVRLARDVPVEAPSDVNPLTLAARRDLYGDALNEAVFMRSGQAATAALVTAERRGLDGAVGLLPAGVHSASGVLRLWQTGYARSYALTMLAGTAVLIGAAAVWVS